MDNELMVYDLNKPKQTIELATVLGKFITEKSLSTLIQGKQYVNVEGWQFALSQLGIVPILQELVNISTDAEYKYKAVVDLIRLSDNSRVGCGIAICSNKERTKKSFDEYAIASMAQTRAEGKAARMLLSWLMKAAGFEATPTEEILDTPEGDEIGDSSRQFLQNLLENTTYDDDQKTSLSLRIDSLVLWSEYEKAKATLMANQIQDKDRIHMGMNYSQTDIKKTLKKQDA